MTPQTIVDELLACDIDIRLTDDGSGISVPAGSLTFEQRTLVLANKPALIDYLLEAQRLTARLIAAAMRRCDQFSDGPAAREEMRQDCQGTPAHLRADLLAYFDYCSDRPGPERTQAVSQAKAATEKASRPDPEPPADPAAWRELAAAYHRHHFSCPQCIAGGQGRGLRCGVGAALWNIYQSTD